MNFPAISASFQMVTMKLKVRVAQMPVLQIAKETSLAIDTTSDTDFQTFGITK